MVKLSLALFGHFRFTVNDRPLDLKSTHARALLAYLAVESDYPQSRQAVAGLFWPDRDEESAQANLRVQLYQLRRALGDTNENEPLLRTSRAGIQFNTSSSARVDVLAFQSLVRATRNHAHAHRENCPECMSRFREAACLYEGEFLQDLVAQESAPFQEWGLMKREDLHRQAREVFENLGAFDLEQGDFEEAEEFARRQLTIEPWEEIGHRQLMRALARRGRRDQALAQYERCRAILAKEMGIEPESQTTALYNQIREERLG